jgi:hypothetical protein
MAQNGSQTPRAANLPPKPVPPEQQHRPHRDEAAAAQLIVGRGGCFRADAALSFRSVPRNPGGQIFFVLLRAHRRGASCPQAR